MTSTHELPTMVLQMALEITCGYRLPTPYSPALAWASPTVFTPSLSTGLHSKMSVWETRLSCTLQELQWNSVLPMSSWKCSSQERLGITHDQRERKVGASHQICSQFYK